MTPVRTGREPYTYIWACSHVRAVVSAPTTPAARYSHGDDHKRNTSPGLHRSRRDRWLFGRMSRGLEADGYRVTFPDRLKVKNDVQKVALRSAFAALVPLT